MIFSHSLKSVSLCCSGLKLHNVHLIKQNGHKKWWHLPFSAYFMLRYQLVQLQKTNSISLQSQTWTKNFLPFILICISVQVVLKIKMFNQYSKMTIKRDGNFLRQHLFCVAINSSNCRKQLQFQSNIKSENMICNHSLKFLSLCCSDLKIIMFN
jgi:hypothetical protein